MIEIGKTIVALDVLQEQFICDLKACKGACCIEGDSGAPLEEPEKKALENDYEKIKPYMRPEGIAAIEAQGKHVIDDWDGESVTPLVNGNECAYVSFSEDGTAGCAIENAWADGATEFRKPISCHLYPVRIKKYAKFEAVNYDRWGICSAACTLGKSQGVEVYRFVKDALVTKYGEAWYAQLEEAATLAKKMEK